MVAAGLGPRTCASAVPKRGLCLVKKHRNSIQFPNLSLDGSHHTYFLVNHHTYHERSISNFQMFPLLFLVMVIDDMARQYMAYNPAMVLSAYTDRLN